MMSISFDQSSSYSRVSFSANSLHTVASVNSSAAASRLNELNSNRVINRTAMNDPTASAVSDLYGNKAAEANPFSSLVRPGKPGRSRINPFDDTPDIEPDVQHAQDQNDRPTLPYNPNPFHVETPKNTQLSEGPALISLRELKKMRQLPQSAGQKKPLAFGAIYSPTQYVCQMMRFFALMIEPI